MIVSVLLTLLLLQIAPQDPAAPPLEAAPPEFLPAEVPVASRPSNGEGWKLLNRPALIVNEELVTAFDIQTAVRRVARRAEPPIQSQSGLDQLFQEAITARAEEMLKVQGGKDLGFDPELVHRLVQDYLKAEKESLGSISRLAEELKKEEKDRFMREEEFSNYVNLKLWEDSATGKSPSPGGRPSRDRFPRPGLVWFRYRESPPPARQVQITQLIIHMEEGESADQSRARTEALRARVVEGEDMGKLADEFGATNPGTRGLAEVPVSSLKQGYPELCEFLSRAEVGDLSEVCPYRKQVRPGEWVPRGWIVVRPEAISDPEIPAFGDRVYQQRLTEDYQRSLDRLRTNSGLRQLLQAAYVWPPEATGGAPEQ